LFEKARHLNWGKDLGNKAAMPGEKEKREARGKRPPKEHGGKANHPTTRRQKRDITDYRGKLHPTRIKKKKAGGKNKASLKRLDLYLGDRWGGGKET